MDISSPSEFGIADLRRERGETLEQFARAVGIASKGRMSEIEKGQAPVSLAVALAIEALSAGRIDAAALCPAVAAARRQPAAA
jgi:transcriptional regulator with XRE-family HTH domain